jgi:Uma2 family endonuclease
MTGGRRRALRYADYLEAEAASPERHALHDGVVYAMTGGSTAHAVLTAELLRLLGNALAASPCFAASGDQRLYIDEDNATYADAVVLCPPLRRPPQDPHAVCNPTVIVEVLSPSTAAWDRGGKFDLYAQLPSLRTVLFIEQDQWRVEQRDRLDGGGWRLQAHGPGGVVRLDQPALTLEVDALYQRVEAAGGPGRGQAPRPAPRRRGR